MSIKTNRIEIVAKHHIDFAPIGLDSEDWNDKKLFNDAKQFHAGVRI